MSILTTRTTDAAVIPSEKLARTPYSITARRTTDDLLVHARYAALAASAGLKLFPFRYYLNALSSSEFFEARSMHWYTVQQRQWRSFFLLSLEVIDFGTLLRVEWFSRDIENREYAHVTHFAIDGQIIAERTWRLTTTERYEGMVSYRPRFSPSLQVGDAIARVAACLQIRASHYG